MRAPRPPEDGDLKARRDSAMSGPPPPVPQLAFPSLIDNNEPDDEESDREV